MSFYRTFITAVAAMGLATAVFAEETTTNATATPAPSAEATQAAATAPAAEKTAAVSAEATQEKINLNKATAKDLAKVKGMSMTKAKAIVAFRKKHGDFKSVEDLKEVKGFKKMDEKTLKDIAEQLTVG